MTSTITPTDWTDADTIDLIADCMDSHHDMGVTFHHHARHIVAALRNHGLITDGLNQTREELAGLAGRCEAALGEAFSFISSSVWPSHPTRAAVNVVLHLNKGMPLIFHGDDFRAAIAAVDAYLEEHDTRRVEAMGWATLGVEHAA
jgi:hypothetical protein